MSIQINREAWVPYTCQQMFDLVNDIPSYPSFLPHCQGSSILSSDSDEITAQLTLKKGIFKQTLTTVNQLQPPTMITIALKEGPFQALTSTWQFTPNQDGCQVQFSIVFSFQLAGFGRWFSGVFEALCQNQVQAFCQEAKRRYAGK